MFPELQSIKRIIWDYKSEKQEMFGNIAQPGEHMTVNHVVEGSSPSVPVWFLIQQRRCVIGSSPIIPEMECRPAGRAIYLYFENCKKQRYAATAMT